MKKSKKRYLISVPVFAVVLGLVLLLTLRSGNWTQSAFIGHWRQLDQEGVNDFYISSEGAWVVREGRLPFHVRYVISNADPIEIVDALLANGADPGLKDVQGYTPLEAARKYVSQDFSALMEKSIQASRK